VLLRPRGFRVFRGADGVAEAFGATVVAFGKFDGVHIGHRALLDRAAAAAGRLGLPHGALSFERHPYAYLRNGQVPPVLTSLGERLRLLRQAGVDFVVLIPTDATVLGVPAEEFARDVLHARMGVRLVVVGENFRFGQGGTGGSSRCAASCRRPAWTASRWGRSRWAARPFRRPASATISPSATWPGPASSSRGRTRSSDG